MTTPASIPKTQTAPPATATVHAAIQQVAVTNAATSPVANPAAAQAILNNIASELLELQKHTNILFTLAAPGP